MVIWVDRLLVKRLGYLMFAWLDVNIDYRR